MKTIQQYFKQDTGKEIVIPKDVYKGPLVIDRPCVVDGGGSTLWGIKGPVLVINAANVVVRNLTVEVVQAHRFGMDKAAIQANYANARFSNVSVIGEVKGLSNEPDWNLPEKFDLGEFNADDANEFRFNVKALQKARVECTAGGVHVTPTELETGVNVLTLHVEQQKDGEYVFGEVLLRSGGITRKIPVTGHAKSRSLLDATPTSAPTPTMGNLPARAPVAAATTALRRGQRVPLADLDVSKLSVTYQDQGKPQGVEVDLLAALVQDNGKVRFENDFVFFNNLRSKDGSVVYDGNAGFTVNLNKTADYVSRIALACVVDGGNKKLTLSNVKAPTFRLQDRNGVGFTYTPDVLGPEKSLVMLELYRYKNEWKLSVVGMGYEKGIDYLCDLYGLAVD